MHNINIIIEILIDSNANFIFLNEQHAYQYVIISIS